MKTKLIGIAGYATVGKDTFYTILADRLAAKGIQAKRYAFADALKQDLVPFFKEKYNLDVFNLTQEQKKELRGLLVSHGCYMRSISNGKYWIDKINSLLDLNSDNLVNCITDCRFLNEAEWIKQKGGIIVHISRYSKLEFEKVFVCAPNEEESKNDPLVKNIADYFIEWPTTQDINSLGVYVDGILERSCSADWRRMTHENTGRDSRWFAAANGSASNYSKL